MATSTDFHVYDRLANHCTSCHSAKKPVMILHTFEPLEFLIFIAFCTRLSILPRWKLSVKIPANAQSLMPTNKEIQLAKVSNVNGTFELKRLAHAL